MIEDAEVGDNSDGGNDEIIKKLLPSKMLRGSTWVSYLSMLQKKMSFPW